MMDAGVVTICTLVNTATAGDMPKYRLQAGDTFQFEERNYYLERIYEANGAAERFDMNIRIWRAPVKIGQYALLTDYEGQENADGDQYQIEDVRNDTDLRGLKVTDLTLKKVNELYEVITS